MTDQATNHAYITAEWIRRPLVDLGGVSPQDAVADPQGRKKLEDLLIELAGHHVRLTNLGLPALDPNDLRHALGMEAAAATSHARHPSRAVRVGQVKRSALLDELGTALTGGDVDSVAFLNVKTGAIEHFMHNLGDQETARIAQAQSDADMRKISPVTTEVRYGMMSDFIGLVDDINVAGRLRSAISGKGAFRRFREAVDEDDGLRRRWLSYRTKRHYLLALDWLHKLGLNPEQFGLSVADYDWQPPSAEADHPAAAAAPSATAAQTEAAQPEAAQQAAESESRTTSNGQAAEEPAAQEHQESEQTQSAETAAEPQPAS